ncbi:MAG TPA: DUF4412 domain-containing protein [Bacteroidota bacterium]
MIESRNTTTDALGAEQQYVMTMWIKGAMAKITTSATSTTPASTMIYRSDLRVIRMLDDDNKTYFEVPQGKMKEDATAEGGGNPAPVKKTGKTKKILGYRCEQFLINQGEAETEIWGTKDLRGLSASLARALGEERAGQGTAWNDEITKLGIFPLLANTRIEGKVVDSQEVLKIEKRSLGEDIFSLPGGYRKQSVGDILK